MTRTHQVIGVGVAQDNEPVEGADEAEAGVWHPAVVARIIPP